MAEDTKQSNIGLQMSTLMPSMSPIGAFLQADSLRREEQKKKQEAVEASGVLTDQIETEMAPTPIPGTDIKIPGMGMVTKRKVPVDWTKVKFREKIGIANVLNLDDEDYVTNQFMTWDAVENQDGEIEILPDTFEERVEMMNQFGAVRAITQDAQYVDFPFEEAVAELTRVPDSITVPGPFGVGELEINYKDMSASAYNRLAYTNRIFGAALGANQDEPGAEVIRAMHAQHLNEKLLRQNVPARARYFIINDALESIAIEEAKRIGTLATETFGRGTIEAGLYMIGEIAGWFGDGINTWYNEDISSYTGRQALLDMWWKPASQELQDEWASRGIDMDISTAEDLAREQTGLPAFTARLFLEMNAPNKVSNFFTTANAKYMHSQYRAYVKKQFELSGGKEIPEEKLIKGFIDEYKAGNFGIRKGILRQGDDKLDKITGERLARAFQVNDASLPPEMRVEVVQQTDRLSALTDQRTRLVKQRDNPETYSPDLDEKIRNIDSQVEEISISLTGIQRRSAVPKFIRDYNVQDRYVLAGAASVGFFFEEASMMDRDLGSLIGVGVGFATSYVRGKVPAGIDYIKSYTTKDTRKRTELLVRHFQRAAPEIRDMAVEHARRIDLYRTKLENAGVDATVLDVTLPVLTDIVTLRHLQDSISKTVAVKDTIKGNQVKQLQQIRVLGEQLNSELDRILKQMESTGNVDEVFFETVKRYHEDAKVEQQNLKTLLDVVSKEGVGGYLNVLHGNSGVLSPTSPGGRPDISDHMTFDEAMTVLRDKNLIDMNAVPAPEFQQHLINTYGPITQLIKNKADELKLQFGAGEEARAFLQTKDNPDVAMSVGPLGLFEMHLVSRHGRAKEVASKDFVFLKSDNSVFLDSTNQRITTSPTVPVLDVILDLTKLDYPGTGPLLKVQGKGMRPGDIKAIDDTLVELTSPFFMNAAMDAGMDVDEYVAKMVKQEKKKDPAAFPKGRNKQAMLAQKLIIEAAENDQHLPFFDMDPMQYAELDRFVRALGFKYMDDGTVSRKLTATSKLVESKYGDFEVIDADGNARPLGNLRVLNQQTGEIEGTLPEIMERGRRAWREYKENWYDLQEGAFVPRLMSWGKQRVNEKGVTNDNPSGKAYDKAIDNWMTLDMLTNKQSAKNIMLSINRTLGSFQLTKGNRRGQGAGRPIGYRLVQGDIDTETFRSYFSAFVGEKLKEMVENGATMQDMYAAARKIEDNFKMLDANGREISLINPTKHMDDTYGPWQSSVSAEAAKKIEKEVSAEINTAIDKFAAPAKKRKENLDEAVSFLRGMLPDVNSADDIGSIILDGGTSRYRQITSTLASLDTMDEAAVKQVIRDAVVRHIRKRVFKPTGRKRAESVVSQDESVRIVETDIVAESRSEIVRLLGETDEQRKLMKEILGDDNYEILEAMSGFLSETENTVFSGQNISIRGIPRGLSPESFVSRMYAYNRGIVGAPYLGTEAALQGIRKKDFEFFMLALEDIEVGRAFAEMVRTGRPLEPKRDAAFRRALINAAARLYHTQGTETKEIVDTENRRYTVNATPADIQRTGREFTGLNPNEMRQIGLGGGAGDLILPSLDITAP